MYPERFGEWEGLTTTPTWSTESAYIYHERMGVGIELGMSEAEAHAIAYAEAMKNEQAKEQTCKSH